jgi:phosphoglycerol transferase MdoB-like AlkP superfamily enzyme
MVITRNHQVESYIDFALYLRCLLILKNIKMILQNMHVFRKSVLTQMFRDVHLAALMSLLPHIVAQPQLCHIVTTRAIMLNPSSIIF